LVPKNSQIEINFDYIKGKDGNYAYLPRADKWNHEKEIDSLLDEIQTKYQQKGIEQVLRNRNFIVEPLGQMIIARRY
jgi:hypothetical protein